MAHVATRNRQERSLNVFAPCAGHAQLLFEEGSHEQNIASFRGEGTEKTVGGTL
jgi:hypothetical protein